MAIYMVYTPPAMERREALERAEFIRDGFSVVAFLVPFLWLIWNRMILGLGLYLALIGAAVAYGVLGGNPGGALIVPSLISLWFGLEGHALKAWTLARRGWRLDGVIDAESAEEAELRHFAKLAQARPSGAAGLPVYGNATDPRAVVGLFPTAGGRA